MSRRVAVGDNTSFSWLGNLQLSANSQASWKNNRLVVWAKSNRISPQKGERRPNTWSGCFNSSQRQTVVALDVENVWKFNKISSGVREGQTSASSFLNQFFRLPEKISTGGICSTHWLHPPALFILCMRLSPITDWTRSILTNVTFLFCHVIITVAWSHKCKRRMID